ncbi:MAG: RNA methyltransferase [Planctomycetes bacterium]|nr:RNA methyltransferase [Planctomycetota bacterium]
MEPTFEAIRSRKNPLVAEMRRLGAARRSLRGRRALVEGLHPIEEAAAAGAAIEAILVRDDACAGLAPVLARIGARRIASVPPDVIASAATTKSPPPILAAVALPDAPFPDPAAGRGVVLDGIQDPGNVGAILRSAVAFGIDWALLTPDAADPFGPKEMRASAGLVFRIRVATLPREEIARRIAELPAIAAVASGGHPYQEGPFPPEGALLLGSEARGLSPQIAAVANDRVSIPTAPGVESLNAAVAAGILLAAWCR